MMTTNPDSPQISSANGLYVLRLFVAGDMPHSVEAKKNIERICEVYLHGSCELTVFDVRQDYKTALDHGVLLTPTLLLVSPPPQVTIVGTLNDTAKVLAALGIREHAP